MWVMVVEQPRRCLDARGSGVPLRAARWGAALTTESPPKGRRRQAAIRGGTLSVEGGVSA
jgi:hypothetical protein